MRTAPKIVAEIKALDPGSEVTEHYISEMEEMTKCLGNG